MPADALLARNVPALLPGGNCHQLATLLRIGRPEAGTPPAWGENGSDDEAAAPAFSVGLGQADDIFGFLCLCTQAQGGQLASETTLRIALSSAGRVICYASHREGFRFWWRPYVRVFRQVLERKRPDCPPLKSGGAIRLWRIRRGMRYRRRPRNSKRYLQLLSSLNSVTMPPLIRSHVLL